MRLVSRQPLAMPSAFAAAELEQALSEIPWGKRTHHLLPDDPSTPGAARAEVGLLDDDHAAVTVACSESGWAIVGSTGRCIKVRPHPLSLALPRR